MPILPNDPDRYYPRPIDEFDWCVWDIRQNEPVSGSDMLREHEARQNAQRMSQAYRRAISPVEIASRVLLLWWPHLEMRDAEEFSEVVERRASRIGGVLLFALAGYVIVSAGYGVWRQEGQEFSGPGFILALLAIPIMWSLSKSKLRIADQIGSQALRADAVESITCGYLSGVIVLGLIVQLLMPGWWWVDSVASLAIVLFLVKEGREAWEEG